MPPRSLRRGSVPAVLAVFTATGFVMGQTVARVPALRDAVGASTGQLGLALMGMGLGSLLAMPFTGRLVDRAGSRTVVTVAAVVGCLGYAALAAAPSVALLMTTFLVTGTAVGVWDVAMNIQASHVERQRDRAWMPLFHAAFSGGAVLGAAAGALAAWRGIGLVQLPVLAALALAVAVGGARRFVPEDHEDGGGHEGGGDAGDGVPGPGRRRRGVTRLELLIGLVCLSAALGEGSANDWLALLLVDVQGAPEAFGALALTAFNLTMTVGRVLGGPAIDRLGRDTVVRVGGVLAGVGILVVTLVHSLALALVGGLLWGLGVSTIFPAAMSAAGEVPGRGNRAITVVSTIAYGAFLFGAPTIGVLAEHVGLDRALFIVVGFLVLMVVLAPVMRVREDGA